MEIDDYKEYLKQLSDAELNIMLERLEKEYRPYTLEDMAKDFDMEI